MRPCPRRVERRLKSTPRCVGNGLQGFQTPIADDSFVVDGMGAMGRTHTERGLTYYEVALSGHRCVHAARLMLYPFQVPDMFLRVMQRPRVFSKGERSIFYGRMMLSKLTMSMYLGRVSNHVVLDGLPQDTINHRIWGPSVPASIHTSG